MKLLVCVKTVQDMDGVLPEDWNHWTEENNLDYVKRIYNCFDEAALETALRIRDEAVLHGREVVLQAVTIAPDAKLMAHLYALGFERVDQIPIDLTKDHSPRPAARLLEAYVRANGGFDLILCGIQAEPGNYGMTGILLAEQLNIPCLTNVTEVEFDKELTVIRQLGDLLHRLQVRLPLVLTIGNARNSYLRLPTLREKIAAKSKAVKLWNPPDICCEPGVELLGLNRETGGQCCQIIDGTSAAEKARKVYDRLFGEEAQG